MALNFRLSYNNGYGYTDLLPDTKIGNIIPDILTSRDYAIAIKIPPSTDLVQTIPLNIPSKYINSQAFVDLLYEKETDFYDYNTITQVNVVKTGIEIIRLYRHPTDAIRVVLILNANEKNLLKDSEMELTIPAYDGFVQEISAPITEAQAIGQFFVELVGSDNLVKRAYTAISQIEAQKGKILIYRFSEKSDTEIKIKLRFREGGT